MRHKKRLLAVALSSALLASAVTSSHAGEPATPAKTDVKKQPEKKKQQRFAEMDYGPFLTASIISDPRAKFDNGPGSFTGDSTARGVAIKLSDDWRDGVVFDMDLMRISAGWVDGNLKLTGLISDGNHGPGPTIGVPPLFQTPHLPGWAGPDGTFKDPRRSTIDPLPPPGPLPRDFAHYKGLYRHGDKVILSYSVGSANVLEMPSLVGGVDPAAVDAAKSELWDKEYANRIVVEGGVQVNLGEIQDDFNRRWPSFLEEWKKSHGGAKAIVRTIWIDKTDKPLAIMIADSNPVYPYPGCKKQANIADAKTGDVKVAADGTSGTVIDTNVALITGAAAGARLEANASQLIAKVPASREAITLQIYLGGGDKAAFDQLVQHAHKPIEPEGLVRGGPSLWKETVTTKGKLGEAKKGEAYVVDSLALPNDNPYKAWIRPGGMDFFADGTRAAISTWSGDVWVVSGIDEKLENLTWKRVATGLHQPLGLKIVKDQIYTLGHDQITHLVDLDGDGEADFYENVNNDWELTSAFHAFAFDLQTDPQGNFVFAFGSPVHAGGGGFQKITNHHGTILRVSPDGQKMEVVAAGLRAPNGIGMNPETGQITSSDNQGTWVPVCPIHWVKPGAFLGVVDSAHRPMKSTDKKPDPAEQPKPLAWLPYPKVDNSGGGQVWVTSDNWGPFKGDLLHTSYGTSSLWKVMYEEINGQVQGGVAKFPVKFTSSAMRPRFNPKDGQLYVAGLRGWQSNAASDGGFDRVRFTGGEVRMPKSLHVTENGVAITFTCALNPEDANDPQNYSVEAWNVRWTGAYGSAEYKPSNPELKGHDTWKVKSAKLQSDGKTVVLEIEGIKPVMLMSIDYDISSADKEQMRSSIYNTIHNLGKASVTAVK